MDTDPAFFTSMRIRIRGAKLLQIHVDPDNGQTLSYKKLAFYMKNKIYFLYVIGHKTYLRKYTYKSLFERFSHVSCYFG